MMSNIGPAGLLVMVVMLALVIIPFWKILPRAGIPAPVALIAVVPLAALVLLWVLAFKKWPGDSA